MAGIAVRSELGQQCQPWTEQASQDCARAVMVVIDVIDVMAVLAVRTVPAKSWLALKPWLS